MSVNNKKQQDELIARIIKENEEYIDRAYNSKKRIKRNKEEAFRRLEEEGIAVSQEIKRRNMLSINHNRKRILSYNAKTKSILIGTSKIKETGIDNAIKKYYEIINK